MSTQTTTKLKPGSRLKAVRTALYSRDLDYFDKLKVIVENMKGVDTNSNEGMKEWENLEEHFLNMYYKFGGKMTEEQRESLMLEYHSSVKGFSPSRTTDYRRISLRYEHID